MKARTRLLQAIAVAAALSMVPGLALAQSPSATSSSSESSGGQPTGMTVASDTLVGTKVFDKQGKEVGSIDKLLIDPQNGRVASVLIKEGGTAGMGGKELSLPWSALKIQRGEKGLVATMQQEGLEQVPSASPSTDPSRRQGQPEQRRQ